MPTWKVRETEYMVADDREALARLVGENDAASAEEIDTGTVDTDSAESIEGNADGDSDGSAESVATSPTGRIDPDSGGVLPDDVRVIGPATPEGDNGNPTV